MTLPRGHGAWRDSRITRPRLLYRFAAIAAAEIANPVH